MTGDWGGLSDGALADWTCPTTTMFMDNFLAPILDLLSFLRIRERKKILFFVSKKVNFRKDYALYYTILVVRIFFKYSPKSIIAQNNVLCCNQNLGRVFIRARQGPIARQQGQLRQPSGVIVRRHSYNIINAQTVGNAWLHYQKYGHSTFGFICYFCLIPTRGVFS